MHSESPLPGAALGFRDVTRLFQDAAADMSEEQMVFMDGFTLQDAMSAFEIGEPRLDSGYIPPGEVKPKFDPLTPLLPEELCWIMDRAFSYEMEWHCGNFLSHTILTFLYVHHLDAIDPDLVPIQFLNNDDPARPPELVTIVLRAATCGLLKCCDLTWRELSKGAVQDTEDWQSDKCEVSMLEGTPVRIIASALEDASTWVSDSHKVPYQWKDALISRLQLRKAFLQLLDINIHRSSAQFKSNILICQELLDKIRSQPLPQLDEDSVAHLAFDPYISRRLNTAVPIRVLPIGSQEDTWKTFSSFLNGLREICRLAAIHSITTWRVVGNVRAWTTKPPIQPPYIRSLTQSTFYDSLLIFDRYPFVWAVDKFFYETIGITWSSYQTRVNERWAGTAPPPFDLLERDLYKLILPNVRGNWSNPPRRRRQLVKTLANWHGLYDILSEVLLDVDVSDLPRGDILTLVPRAALLWRLSSIREIVLSGFQLELYAPEERTYAYWYLARVLKSELQCYEVLLPAVPQDTAAYQEMLYNQRMTAALQPLCNSLFIMTVPLLSFDWGRTRPNFFRRFKWAFKPEYERFDAPPVAHPDLGAFMSACLKVLKNLNAPPREGIELAVGLLKDLLVEGVDETSRLGGWADAWVGERRKFVEGLVVISENLVASYESSPHSSLKRPGTGSEGTRSAVELKLRWDPAVHPWFPTAQVQ